jgi:hypothetical protein
MVNTSHSGELSLTSVDGTRVSGQRTIRMISGDAQRPCPKVAGEPLADERHELGELGGGRPR